MKIKHEMLSSILEIASIWSGKAAINPCELDFQEKKVVERQKDSMGKMGCFMMASKGCFTEYEDIGTVQLRSDTLIEQLRKGFTDSEILELNIDKEGESVEIIGKNDEFHDKLRTDVEVLPGKGEFRKISGQVVPSNVSISHGYRIDSSRISDMPMEEIVEFNYGDELVATTKGETWGFKRKIRIEKSKGSDSGICSVDAGFLKDILSRFSGKMWIWMLEEPAIVLSSSIDNKVYWSYTLAEREVE